METKMAILTNYDKLKWALQLVLRDFDDNNNPCLSVAAVNAILSIEDLIRDDQSILARIKERAERVLEGEDWNLAEYCVEAINSHIG